MNTNFSDDLSVLSLNYAGGSRGQKSSPTALRTAVRRSQVECQKVWAFSAAWVSGVDNGTSNILSYIVAAFGIHLKLTLCALCPLCKKCREDWCTAGLHVYSYLYLTDNPSKTELDNSSCTRFLNENSFSVAESLMPEQRPCQTDDTCQAYS